MPIKRTCALADLQVDIMVRRFFFEAVKFKPRSPSFAPSSTITIAGLCSFNNLAIRAKPAEVVSPLILAFMTRTLSLLYLNRLSNKDTQPVPRVIPYSADKLSPNTKTIFGAEWATPKLQKYINSTLNKILLNPCLERQTIRMINLFCNSGTDCSRPVQSANTSAAIEVVNLSERVFDAHGELTILRELNFTVGVSQTVSIVGASGSGKSTL
ncbi:MAG: transporter ATP-binding protein, partial [Solimicrobium sp.]|nr:transporter ATP-binding protein [Solimicrobium sp.]